MLQQTMIDRCSMNNAASINEEDFMNIAESISDEDSANNQIIITRNSRDQIVRIIEVECSRRKILLKRLISSKAIEVKNINIMKESNQSKSKKINLKNLTSKFKKSLKAQALKKLRSSREEKDMKLEMNERKYHVDMTIKHLHSCAKFFLRNSEINLLITKSSVKFTKLMINKTLTRIFCEIVRNVAENKTWKKNEHKILIEKSTYLLLLNKKTSDNYDFIIADSNNMQKSNFHYTNSFESRISRNLIWFTQELATSEIRFRKAIECATRHLKWKIETHRKYRAECSDYINKRVAWKYVLLKKALKISSEIDWSTELFKEKIFRYADPTRIIFFEDKRKMIEEEDTS